MKKLIYSSFLLLLLVGCSDEEKNTSEPLELDSENITKEIVPNEELTKSILEEQGVVAGQVYEQNGLAIGTLSLEANVSDKDANKLAEKYADELKKEYKDLPVNVQAVRDGENIANISLD